MSNTHFRCNQCLQTLLVGTFIATLGGCAATPSGQTPPAAAIQFVSNEQQISEVVAALEMGDTKQARKLLKPMQKREPANGQFRTLQMSMDGNPTEILGTRSFAYTVKQGDRLPTLSNRFLGDPLKFFILARFNGLKDAKIVSGQIIRIPGVAPVAEPAPVTRAKRVPTPPVATTRPSVVPTVPKANPGLATTLRGRGLAALNRGNVAEAVAILRRAKAADPGNNIIQRDLARAERLAASVKARK